jgi:hypothetical protein
MKSLLIQVSIKFREKRMKCINLKKVKMKSSAVPRKLLVGPDKGRACLLLQGKH